MTADWLLISCVASAIGALVLAFILGSCWLAGRADEQAEEAERAVRHVEHRPCPWDMKP